MIIFRFHIKSSEKDSNWWKWKKYSERQNQTPRDVLKNSSSEKLMNLLQKSIVVSIVQKDIRCVFRIMSNSCGGASLRMQLMSERNLFQSSHKTESYSLKEHEAAFLKRQYLAFYIVAGSIWFVFFFSTKYFDK